MSAHLKESKCFMLMVSSRTSGAMYLHSKRSGIEHLSRADCGAPGMSAPHASRLNTSPPCNLREDPWLVLAVSLACAADSSPSTHSSQADVRRLETNLGLPCEWHGLNSSSHCQHLLAGTLARPRCSNAVLTVSCVAMPALVPGPSRWVSLLS